MASSGCVEVFLYLLRFVPHSRGDAVFSVTMTNEFKPLVRDPQQPVNMLQQPTAATPAEPLESLSFPDMREVEAVLSPQDVNKGLAQADPLTRHPRVSSIVLCVVFGLLMLAASAGVWWLGVRTMDGQSYEDIVWSKFDAALPGWLAPVVHVFAISAVVITVSVIMGAIAFAVLIVRKRWLSIAQLAVFGGLCFAAAELLKPLLPRPYLINLESILIIPRLPGMSSLPLRQA